MTRTIKATSRRFVRQALRMVTQGRLFGRPSAARAVQASTTSATAVTLGTTQTQHDVTTDGSGLARAVNVGVAGPFARGQRKLVRLVTRTGASDSFTMDAASLARTTGRAVTSLTFSAAGHQALLEWDGRRWVILQTNAVLV